MLTVAGLILLASFILAALSLRDYKGRREVDEITRNLRKEKIKGGIVFTENEVKHYRSK